MREIRAYGAFRERGFDDLAAEHVPFDDLLGSRVAEGVLKDGLIAASDVAVTGARGSGKSSVLAWVSKHLPDIHVPVRVPVAAMNDPADPAVVTAVVLNAATNEMRRRGGKPSASEQSDLSRSAADSRAVTSGPREAGIKVGGGAIPIELSGRLESLQTELSSTAQPQDRLEGFTRLISIFDEMQLTPVFVLEDTEAIVGQSDSTEDADRFFSEGLKLLVEEVDAPVMIAVQNHLAQLESFDKLRRSLMITEVPRLDEPAHALEVIIDRRLDRFGVSTNDVVAQEALSALADFYSESEGSLRSVMAALDIAVIAAMDDGADELSGGHVNRGIDDARRY